MRGVIARVLLVVSWCTVFFAAINNTAFAASSVTGFVKIAKDRELFVQYQPPAPGKPTLVLLNGLTYRVGSWDKFVAQYEGTGLGVLQYDMMGQGQTLLKYAPVEAPIYLQDQATDLELLLNTLKIRTPVHLVALSYGGAVGMEYATRYPSRVASLVLMAPFTAPLASQDSLIRMQIQQARLMFPYNKATDDELYDYFLKILVYSTYPSAEPIVLENPYKLEATYRLVQGARKFIAKDVAHLLPKGKVHLVIARQDQYISNSVHDEFWEQVPADVRASRINIHGSEHKIPEFIPRFSAAWVKNIAEGNPAIANDRTFSGWPLLGIAESGNVRLEGIGGLFPKK